MKIDINRLCDAPAVAKKAMESHLVPGATLAFIKGGKLAFDKCLGVADPKSGLPVSENTYFEAASLTKTMFARLMIALEAEGVVELGAPMSAYSPIEPPSLDPRFSSATAEHVLTHATGLGNWGKLPMELRFAPGNGFLYSGTGYYYLQRIIECLINTRLDILMQERYFNPLNMDSAALIWTGAMAKSLAATVDEKGCLEKKRNTAKHTVGLEPNAAFSLYATIKDYPKFIMDLMQDNAAIKRITSVKNPVINGIEWGLGWGINGDVLWHWGDNGGYKSLVRFDPATKDGVIIHTNGTNGLEVCYKVAGFVTGENLDDMANMISEAE